MKFVIRRMAAALLLAAGLVGHADASFTQLLVFGDSLSDAGNAAALSAGNFPPTPPYAGTFSNGPTAAQYLAQQYGIAVELGWGAGGATPASNNYAVGGGRNGMGNYNVEIDHPTGLGVAFPALATTGIAAQIGRYAAQHPTGISSPDSTLVMVWGGPNDIFLGAETGADPNLYVPGALNDLASDLLALVGMGATQLLVPGMPDLGLTPEALSMGPAAAAGLSALSAAYNGGMDQMLTFLGGVLAPMGVHVYGFDTAAFLAGVTGQFTDTTHSCLYSGAWFADSSCAGYLYFDNVHPTTAAHALLARGFAQAVPEPSTYALMLGGLLALAALRRRCAAR